jgi:iron(III) transport system ATP-binding protein
MKEGGTLEQIGTPETVYRQPKTAYVADFLGQTNFIHAHVKDGIAETPFGRVKVDSADAGNVLLSIRPECLKMIASDAQSSTTKSGRIVGQAFKGHDFTYRVEVDGQHYFVQTDYRCPFQVGDTVLLEAASAVAVMPETT